MPDAVCSHVLRRLCDGGHGAGRSHTFRKRADQHGGMGRIQRGQTNLARMAWHSHCSSCAGPSRFSWLDRSTHVGRRANGDRGSILGRYSLIGRGSKLPLADTAGNFIRCVPVGVAFIGEPLTGRLLFAMAGIVGGVSVTLLASEYRRQYR